MSFVINTNTMIKKRRVIIFCILFNDDDPDKTFVIVPARYVVNPLIPFSHAVIYMFLKSS